MRKKIFSAVFVLIGVAIWIALSQTAQFSFKKWDAKFEEVLRNSLNTNDITKSGVLSSVHAIQKDEAGEWVAHKIRIDAMDAKTLKRIQESFERSGAKIVKKKTEKGMTLLIKRGERVYQEISIVDLKS